MEYSEKQKIEQECFNVIVHEKWDGKSLIIDKNVPPFGEYSGDLLDGAKKFLGSIENKKILEIGCGNGELSVWLAKNNAEVWGVDISDESIKIAETRSKENSTSHKTHFFAQPAETIPFENNFFDIIFINVTLHHLEVEKALKKFHEVMKEDGVLVAIEPFIFSNKIQKMRTSKFFTKLYPIYQETPTERILDKNDLALIQKEFPQVQYVPFRIFSPFVFKVRPLFTALSYIFFPHIPSKEIKKQKLNRLLQKIDEVLLRVFPFMKFLSRYVVIEAKN